MILLHLPPNHKLFALETKKKEAKNKSTLNAIVGELQVGFLCFQHKLYDVKYETGAIASQQAQGWKMIFFPYIFLQERENCQWHRLDRLE